MDKTLTHKVVDNMSMAIDGIMECITIDIIYIGNQDPIWIHP